MTSPPDLPQNILQHSSNPAGIVPEGHLLRGVPVSYPEMSWSQIESQPPLPVRRPSSEEVPGKR